MYLRTLLKWSYWTNIGYYHLFVLKLNSKYESIVLHFHPWPLPPPPHHHHHTTTATTTRELIINAYNEDHQTCFFSRTLFFYFVFKFGISSIFLSDWNIHYIMDDKNPSLLFYWFFRTSMKILIELEYEGSITCARNELSIWIDRICFTWAIGYMCVCCACACV